MLKLASLGMAMNSGMSMSKMIAGVYGRRMCSSSAASTVYEGKFAAKLHLLKRISFGTCMLSVTGLPTLFLTGQIPTSISPTGQIAIVCTALVSSVGSTVLLHLITHPYVSKLLRLPSKNGGEVNKKGEYEAHTFTYRGSTMRTRFTAKDVMYVGVQVHPFANVRARHKLLYLFPPDIQDRLLCDIARGGSAATS
jgi:hypothetical protein